MSSTHRVGRFCFVAGEGKRKTETVYKTSNASACRRVGAASPGYSEGICGRFHYPAQKTAALKKTAGEAHHFEKISFTQLIFLTSSIPFDSALWGCGGILIP